MRRAGSCGPAGMIDAADILRSRILIAGAETADVALLERMLDQEGYENVTSTMKPQEVCALHRSEGHDMIMLDLQMPGIDVCQLMELLRTNGQDPGVGVLVITAQPGERLRGLRAGARDFISKPFDVVDVKTRVRNTLEVRLLYQRLAQHAKSLEASVLERTAELRESVARYRSLTELASDWYWEQDEHGTFTKVFGPVFEMLGLRVDGSAEGERMPLASWNGAERADLQAAIAERRPFLDFVFSRISPDGSQQRFQVSGEPMFGPACQLVGYRGIGLEITARK